ncbi:TPA: hypothetical protein IAA68_02010 [Candidatus Galligastranaerophilus faecipullorum]|nr:hypothetical protein [Candidatus Galligastranaerophilus faecipullorum]
MAISPISSISSFAYIYNISSEDDKQKQQEELNILLRQYDLIPTDDYEKDVERLRAAMIQEQIERAQEQQEQMNETEGFEERPWYEIMWELGLHQNDSVQEDYDDIMDELDKRIMGAQNEEEFTKYDDMRIRAQEYFNEYAQGTSMSFDNSLSSSMAGLSALAVMNLIDVNFA